MNTVKTLASHADPLISSHFEKAVADVDVHNVFNPSFYCSPGTRIFTFRAIVRGEQRLSAFFSIEDGNGRTTRLLSPELSGYPAVPRFIDPKVVRIGEDILITFNSGWMETGNDVFIMPIHPVVGSPKRLLYQQRMPQERNWAFFGEGGEIYALYWINPLRILRLASVTDDHWIMEDHYRSEAVDTEVPPDLTVGTQLVRCGEAYCFIAHQKRLVRDRKLYLGRLCTLDFQAGRIGIGKCWLAHSSSSLLGAPVKHNTNLFSCTYFSGLQAFRQGLTLSYGINDIDFGFATLSADDM